MRPITPGVERAAPLAQHRSWMIRSYLVAFGFVTFRVINLTLTGAAAWLCWTIPLLLAEVSLRWSNSRREAHIP